MSLAAASHAAALCRPTVSGTSRSRPAAFASCEQHRGRLDAPGVASVAPASTVRLARGRRGRPSTTVTRAHVGDPEWFANQALAAGVILAGFVATGGLEELGQSRREVERAVPPPPALLLSPVCWALLWTPCVIILI